MPYLREFWDTAPVNNTADSKARLVEPFCGGLAVTLGMSPERALLNDINPHLINFYRHLQRGLSITLAMQNDSVQYYAHRARFNALITDGLADSAEAAQLFYYLNRSGYNGLCRFNRSGAFNVPFGKYRTINYATDFSAYRSVLAKWTFTVGSFENIALAPDDFIYADPPYDVEFVSYTKEGFTWADQERLMVWLDQHSGPVILSNQATDRIIALYVQHGYDLVYLMSPRRINSTGDRTPAKEVLAFRNVAVPDYLLTLNVAP